ncbi:hypothetical protein FA13DRAFT_1794971 [Coprinellus micaceus]|uniref:Uncharacterized protein n=1 Tax=Coprinellus micaceus TaxID=71717 RepID=A0A4Y7SZ87_COPMI|nr:hypothetical protein FA13DRAFT_1794971 [Coprinellus micaceus]
MPRSKPIPPQILQMVEQGDLPSLRHLERLISPGNVTEEILATIFKCLTSHPVPVASDWVNELVLKTRVGSRPSACLCVFWKIFDLISRQGGTSKLEPTLLKHLLESDDMLLEGYSPRANRYLTVAHHLLMLLKLDEDYRAVMLSSTAFINLFLELWLVEDRRDRSGKLIWRMVNSKDFFGCSIIDLADTILSDSTSQEFILKRCVTAQQCDLFSRALDGSRYAGVGRR